MNIPSRPARAPGGAPEQRCSPGAAQRFTVRDTLTTAFVRVPRLLMALAGWGTWHTHRLAEVETPAYGSFLERILTAMGRRVGQGDPEDLRDLLRIAAFLDQVVADAVQQIHARYSWTQIGAAAGITKQSAQERWGKHAQNDGG